MLTESLTKMLNNCIVRECLWQNWGLVLSNNSSSKDVINSVVKNMSLFVVREIEHTETSVLCVKQRIL